MILLGITNTAIQFKLYTNVYYITSIALFQWNGNEEPLKSEVGNSNASEEVKSYYTIHCSCFTSLYTLLGCGTGGVHALKNPMLNHCKVIIVHCTVILTIVGHNFIQHFFPKTYSACTIIYHFPYHCEDK